jgi:hypothetical protein
VRSGRRRDIDYQVDRILAGPRGEQFTQLPQVEQAMGRQALAHLRTLNTAVTNITDLEDALGEAFANTPTRRSSPASQDWAPYSELASSAKSAMTGPASPTPKRSKHSPAPRRSPPPAVRWLSESTHAHGMESSRDVRHAAKALVEPLSRGGDWGMCAYQSGHQD